jgi:hypothetical protein
MIGERWGKDNLKTTTHKLVSACFFKRLSFGEIIACVQLKTDQKHNGDGVEPKHNSNKCSD